MAISCIVFLACSVLIIPSNSQRMGDNVAYRPNTCLAGDKHTDPQPPRPEDDSYAACELWEEGACCSAEFTQQLAAATVTNIDGFHWNRCGDLSLACEQFFIEIECFYRCSPNIAHFALDPYPSALANLPICSDYCDRWFQACQNDMTCVVNWVTDWVVETNGSNYCPVNASCNSYRDVYTDGAGICNMLWGSSFFYSDYSSTDPDSERECLIPSFPIDQPNPNDAAIANLFADDIDNGSMPIDNGSMPIDNGSMPMMGMSGGYVFVLLAMVFILLIL